MTFKIASIFCSALLLCAGWVMSGCHDDNTPDNAAHHEGGGDKSDDEHSDDVTPIDDDPTALPAGVVLDSWGVADAWYAYDIHTHKVTPGDASWIVQEADGTTYFLLVEGYYSDEGESGFPRMSVRRWNGNAFDEPQEMASAHSIREAQVCFSISKAQNISCQNDYDIIWRTDRRAIPDAELAIDNPSLYIRSGNGTIVYQSTDRTPPAILPRAEDLGSFHRVYTVFDGDVAPVVDIRLMNEQVSVFQMLATIDVAQWQVLMDPDTDALTIRARCVVAGYKPEKTDPLDGTVDELILNVDDLLTWTFVDLCGGSLIDEGDIELPLPRIAESLNSMRVGQWPRNYTFAFALEKTNDGIQLWIAPDQPVHVENCAENTDDRDVSMWGDSCVVMDDSVAVPPGLWIESE